MRKILFYHDFPHKFELKLKDRFEDISLIVCKDKDIMYQNIHDCEILITFKSNKEMLEKATQLKWIQVLSAGVDNMPLDYIRERGFILTCGRGIHKIHMSEYAIGAMINLARNYHLMFRNQMNGKWNRHVPQGEIYGSTVGILGLGSIGTEIAKKASFFGMRVIGVKNTSENADYVEKVYSQDDMCEVFKESDYVINLLPYTTKTHKIINMEYFNLMKDNACFINMGRGSTVNEEDLIQALIEKKIRALVSDVFYEEPLLNDSPLWKMENVILTPHICGVSSKYMDRAVEIIEYNLEAYLNGGKMMNVIDFKRGY